jgi:diguanylate cyclase (GGDEF)-like protein
LSSSTPSEKPGRSVDEHRAAGLFLSVVDRSTTRIALLLIPSLVISLLLAQALNPIFIPFFAEPLAKHIARELDPKTVSDFEILQVIRRYNLAWCYLTDKDNLRSVEVTAAFTPRTRRIPSTSRPIEIRDEHYYEAVVPYDSTMNLHVGLPFGHQMPKLTGMEALTSILYTPVHFGSVLVILAIVWLGMLILLESIIGLSVRILGGTIDNLTAMVSEPYTNQKVAEATKLSWCPADFRAVGRSLNILMLKVSEVKDQNREKTTEQGLDALKWKGQKRPMFQVTESREKQQSSADYAVESGVFAVKFDKELRSVESSYEFAVMLLDGIHELYTDIIDAAAFIKVEKNQLTTVESCLGLDDDSLALLEKIDHRELIDERNMSKKSIDVGPMLIKKFGLEQLAAKDGFGRVVYLPFSYEGRPLALLAGFMRQGHTPTPERLKALERFRDKALELYHDHRTREDRDDDRWTDPATGMGNKTYFQELMPKIVERMKAKGSDGHFSILMIQPDFSMPRLARFPAEMHDRWFSEIGKLINGVLPISKRIIPEKGATNYMIRYQEHVMAVVLEGINGKDAVNVAEGIRNSVISKSQWSGGATDLSLSVGVATFPRDSESAEEIVAKAATTLSYVKEKLGGNAVCDSQKLPADYKPREATEIQGTLGVLDNVGLLQSISSSEKSGVLIVVNDIGQKFVASWHEGAPVNATLGDLIGLEAVVEFITTFKNGSYNFQTRSIAAGDNNTNDLRSLERCLMEAALFEDKMIAALRMIPTPDRLVRSVDNPAGWQRVSQDPDIMPEEVSAMRELFGMADGTRTLSAIFAKLTRQCTAMRWRAAALLLQYELLQMKID